MNENLHDLPLDLGEDLTPLEGEEEPALTALADQNLPLFFLNDDQDDFGVLNIPGLSFPSRHNLLAEDFQFEFTPPSSPRPPSTSLLASIFLSSSSPSASPLFLSSNIVNITQEPTIISSNLERAPPKTMQAIEKSLPSKLLSSSSTPSKSTPSLPSHTTSKPQSSTSKPATALSKPAPLTSSLPLAPTPKQASLTASLPLLTSPIPSVPSHASKPPASTPKPIAVPSIHKSKKDLMMVRSHSVEMPRIPRKEAKKEMMETVFDMDDNEDKSPMYSEKGAFRPSFENIRPQEWERGPSSSARLQSTSKVIKTRLPLQAHHKTPSAPTSSRKSATKDKDKEKERVEKLTHQKKVLQDKLHEMEKKTQDRTKNSSVLKKNNNNPNTSPVILPQSL